jgi:Asp/Glu/hydantoin racemase
MLGILMLDTAFARIPGDVGHPDTFAFPVRHRVVPGATVDRVVPGDASLLGPFIDAARALVDDGCDGIATTCGFLVRHQRELAAALPVPVLTSSLLQLPTVERLLPRGRRAGIVTFSAADLDASVLVAAGAAADTPVAGLEANGRFAATLRGAEQSLDVAGARDETVAAALRLVARHADVGAIVLECANMPPYRRAVVAATGLPVFDAVLALEWFHAGLATRVACAPRAD